MSTTINVAHTEPNHIAVTSPYDAAFVGRARALGGKWNAATKQWIFDEAAEDAVRHALRDCYGTDGSADDAQAESVTLYLYAAREVSEYCAPVSAGTILLARSFGRDSGARLGTGVAHLRGAEPTSGGSRKNWRTVIPPGCLLAVYGVARALAERAITDDRFVSRIGEQTENADAVLSELSRSEA